MLTYLYYESLNLRVKKKEKKTQTKTNSSQNIGRYFVFFGDWSQTRFDVSIPYLRE